MGCVDIKEFFNSNEMSSEIQFCEACMDGNLHVVESNPYLDTAVYNMGLKLACTFGHLEILKYLDTKMPEHERLDRKLITLAICNRHLEIVKYLYARGLNVLADNGYGFINASKQGDLEMVKYLQPRIAFNYYCEDEIIGESVLLSYENGHSEVFKYLITCYPELKKWLEKRTCSIIKTMYEKGDLEMLKFMHERGVDIRYNDHIVDICGDGHFEVVKWLYEIGADIRTCKDDCMYTACYSNQIEIFKWLHEHGGDIRSRNDLFLKTASKEGHQELVRYMINHGCKF